MKRFALFVSFLVLAAFSVLVWPTRYRYEHMEHPRNGASVLVRIDRINGNAEYLTRSGWVAYLSIRDR
jgi:hypothetical protein